MKAANPNIFMVCGLLYVHQQPYSPLHLPVLTVTEKHLPERREMMQEGAGYIDNLRQTRKS